MQNKGLIWSFIILLTLACLYQLSFTWVAQGVENDAEEFGNGSNQLKEQYLDSMASEVVYPVFDFTYGEVRKNVLNLGLDLKGGMNVTLEVSVAEVVKALSSNSQDESFLKAIDRAKELQTSNQDNFVNLFADAWSEVAGGKKLAGVFYNLENKDKIERNATDEEVIEFIREETDAAFDRTFEVLRTRVNLFGVAQPNIQKLEASDRILVELPGVTNKDRVRQLLQGTAKLEFWETYQNAEVYNYLAQANDKLNDILASENASKESVKEGEIEDEEDLEELVEEDTRDVLSAAPDSSLTDGDSTSQVDEDEGNVLLDQLSDEGDSTALNNGQSFEDFAKDNPFFAIVQAAIFQNEQGSYQPRPGPVVAYVAIKDTAKVNEYLAMPEIASIFPTDMRLLWTAKPFDEEGKFLQLIAIEVKSRDGSAP